MGSWMKTPLAPGDRGTTAQALYQSIFEHAGAPSIIVEDDFGISMANPEFARLTGFSCEEIQGRMTLLDFLPEEEIERVRTYHKARRDGRQDVPSHYECRIRVRSGKLRHILMKVGLIPGPRRTIASLTDITSLRQATEALAEREALYSAILEGYEGYIYFIGPDFRLRFLNENLMRTIGGDATGQFCHRALHGRESPCPWCVSDQVFAGRTVRFEMRNPHDKRWYYSVNIPIRHADGSLSYQAMIEDIHERKQMELALRHSESQLRQENRQLRSSLQERNRFGPIIGRSPAMQAVYEIIGKAAASDANIIIYGESGTGKELVARAIHDSSARRDKAFVPVNCGAIPENLVESEFFGHRKGAFSGAVTDKPGFLDAARGGTLFLDEVGEIDENVQVKLLRAVEGGGYTPVGGTKLHRADMRIIAATNRDLTVLVDGGQMRQDFYYRIHIVPIHLPPLRERREDISLLVEALLAAYPSECRPRLTPELIRRLEAYHWPGNVRELQNVLHRLATIGRLDLGRHETARRGGLDPPSTARDAARPLRATMADAERQLILESLEQHRWNRKAAARQMGIGLRTLQRKLKMLGIT